MVRLQEIAISRSTTVAALVETAIRDIAALGPTAESSLSPLPSWPMGKPLVDISNREELFDRIEDWDRFRGLYGGSPEESTVGIDLGL